MRIRVIGRIALLSGLALAGYWILLFSVQRRLIFPAPRGAPVTSAPRDARRIGLALPFGTVPAWWLPPIGDTGRAPLIIFTHGNAERAEDWLEGFGPARRAGFGVLVVEYPGYGEAPGAPTEASITATVLAAWDWARGQSSVDTTAIVAWGRSLGGGAATRLATRRRVGALILESSFTSLRDFAGRFLAPPFLVRDPFDNLAELSRYRGPLLVLHGERDDVAPIAHGRRLAAAVPGARFVALPCGHNDCDRPWGAVLPFLEAHRGGD